MGYANKSVKRRRHRRTMLVIANACLAGMKFEKHATASRRWQGASHAVYSTSIEGVQVYRTTLAALARVWMELREDEPKQEAV